MDFRRLFVHLGILLWYCFAQGYNLRFVHIPHVINTYGGRLKFLTQWNVWIQVCYFTLCVAADLYGSKTSKLQQTRDWFLAAIAYPAGSFVVLTFWSLYAVDRNLVFPPILDKYVPPWLNHATHTTVLPLLIVEMSIVKHRYPRRAIGLFSTIAFASIYQIWVLWIAYYAELWVYPVLAVLAWPARFLFFLVLWVALVGLYLSGEVVHKLLWSRHPKAPLP